MKVLPRDLAQIFYFVLTVYAVVLSSRVDKILFSAKVTKLKGQNYPPLL